jgi:hypothetical protein
VQNNYQPSKKQPNPLWLLKGESNHEEKRVKRHVNDEADLADDRDNTPIMPTRGSRRVDQQTLNDMINDHTPDIANQNLKPRDTIEKLQ